MVCKSCGASLPEGNAFCTQCGAACHEEPTIAAEVVATPVAEDVSVPEVPAAEPSKKEKKAKEKKEKKEKKQKTKKSKEKKEKPEKVKKQKEKLTKAERKAKKAVKTRKKRPHIALRAFLQTLSVLLCVALLVCVSTAVLLIDLHQLGSAGGIKQFITSALSAPAIAHPQAVQEPLAQIPQSPHSFGAVSLSDTETTVVISGTISSSDPEGIIGEVPDAVFTTGDSDEAVNALIDFLYDAFMESMPEDVDISREQFQTFITESTVLDFLSEKLVGYTEDFINGTANTNITVEEVMDLLEENEALLESTLGIELTEEDKELISEELEVVIVEQDFNNTIRNEINTAVNDTLGPVVGAVGVGVQAVQAAIQFITSDLMIFLVLAICVMLALMLCGANYYNLPAALTWISAPCVLVGLTTVLPLLAFKVGGSLIETYLPTIASFGSVIQAFVQHFAPVHCTVLIVGLVLFVGSMLWRIIRFAVTRKRPLAE